ncbi:hypothetical protein BT69DRAFT_1222905, partial [Atractiella rhizophila]
MSSQKVLQNDPRETVFYASTDGASLQLRRADSNAWVFILIASCYDPKARYLKEHLFLLCIVPGPKNPIDISSFFYLFFKEMAKAATGHWLYDRFKREWFLWRAWLLALLGDMLGSTKFNGCTGHQGKCGCRY